MKNQPKVPLVLWVVCIILALAISGIVLYRCLNPREVAVKFQILVPIRNQTVLSVQLHFLDALGYDNISFSQILYTYGNYEWKQNLNDTQFYSCDNLTANLREPSLDLNTINYDSLKGEISMDYPVGAALTHMSYTATFTAIPNSIVEIPQWW